MLPFVDLSLSCNDLVSDSDRLTSGFRQRRLEKGTRDLG